ncbi:MAG: hypothetical protein ACP5R6_09550 [Chlorobaculum sp.]
MVVVVWFLKQWIDHSAIDPSTRDNETARALFVKSEEMQEGSRTPEGLKDGDSAVAGQRRKVFQTLRISPP